MKKAVVLLLAALFLAAASRAQTKAKGHRVTCNGVEATIVGTPEDDVLTGTPERDVIHGRDGKDVIKGLGGDDLVCGGNDDDEIWLGDGDDFAKGGKGEDTIHGGPGADRIYGGDDNDRIFGEEGDDHLQGDDGDDDLLGGCEEVALGGGIRAGCDSSADGDDRLFGMDGADTLYGARGNDVLNGGDGDDALYGETGDDEFHCGGDPRDFADGGGGNDTFSNAMADCDYWKRIAPEQEPEKHKSEKNLLTVRVKSWNKHLNALLQDPGKRINLCRRHFPLDQAAGEAVEQAVNALNDIGGTNLALRLVAIGHKKKEKMFDSPPTGSYFDMVDNFEDTFVIPCRNRNVKACGNVDYGGPDDDHSVNGFKGTMCAFKSQLVGKGKWGGSGNKILDFGVAINGNCFGGVDQQASPDKPLALHEISHALGMRHPKEWPEEDRAYNSVMKGRLVWPSAYDAAFLRHFYPLKRQAEIVLNFAASTTYMVKNPEGKWNKKEFATNPWMLSYMKAADRVVDASTQELPEFSVAWFNNGNFDQKKKQRLVNALVVAEVDGPNELRLKVWETAPMPAESQNQASFTIDINPTAFRNLPGNSSYELQFHVDYYNDFDNEHSEEDNVIAYPIEIQ